MKQTSQLIKTAALLLLLMLIGLVYLPGLPGGFYFDDYPNIVHNPGLNLASLDWDSLRRAAYSSNAGPLKRPIPMVTFALNHYFSGLDPFGYKLTNLAIHLFNTCLVFLLSLRLLQLISNRMQPAFSAQALWKIAFFAALFWGLHPLNMTSVLFVVQRMNSMAATFSLLALISYLYTRPNLALGKKWLAMMLASTTFFGLLAIYSKENALLLPLFLLLLEYTVFNQGDNTPRYWLITRKAVLALVVAGACGLLAHHLLLSDWATRAYVSRSFTLQERVLTEGRALWQYWNFILLPDSRDMGLYLDDFPVSTSLMVPASTLPALIGHAVAIAIALWMRNKHPVLSFGILWFYIGHLLESTIFPLEIIFEHRNYFPMVGPVIAAIYYVFIGIEASSRKLKAILLPCCLIFIALLGVQTAIRSAQFGDPWGFPFHEAKNHPYSTRANFFAGKICGELMVEFPDKKQQYFDCAVYHFKRSAQVNRSVTEPLIALAAVHVNGSYAVPADLIKELTRRLRSEPLGKDGAYLAKGLFELGRGNDNSIDDNTVDALFKAGLSNPSLFAENKAHFFVSYGLFKCDVMNQCEIGLEQFKQATKFSKSAQFQIVLGTYQLRLGKLADLKKTIELAEARDTLGYFKSGIASLKKNRLLYIQVMEPSTSPRP
jgi:hypothetical protein